MVSQSSFCILFGVYELGLRSEFDFDRVKYTVLSI